MRQRRPALVRLAARRLLSPGVVALIACLSLVTTLIVNGMQARAAHRAPPHSVYPPPGVYAGSWRHPARRALGGVCRPFKLWSKYSDARFLYPTLWTDAPGWTLVPPRSELEMTTHVTAFRGEAYLVGWPCMAYRMTRITVHELSGPPDRTYVFGAIHSDWFPDIPIYPLGLGPLINVATYCALWFGVALFVSCARSWARAKFVIPPHGCLHCAYDLAVTPPGDPCPECGRVGTRNAREA